MRRKGNSWSAAGAPALPHCLSFLRFEAARRLSGRVLISTSPGIWYDRTEKGAASELTTPS